jgi:acetyl esterase/lipase
MHHTLFLLALISISTPFATLYAEEAYSITPDVVYGHKSGMALTFDVFTPKKEANGAAVLFMVSGGWHSRWNPPERAAGRFQLLLDNGFTVFAVRHGSSPKFNIPEVVSDVRSSVRYIRLHAKEFGVDESRMGVFGGSAGGHLSLVLGTTGDDGNKQTDKEKPVDKLSQTSSRVAAVVAFFPPTDIRPWTKESSPYYTNYPALQINEKAAHDFSPRLHVSSDDPPTLLIHGDKDTLVPLEHSKKILPEFAKHKVPAELLVIKGAAHGFRGDDLVKANTALVKWFEKYLVGNTGE